MVAARAGELWNPTERPGSDEDGAPTADTEAPARGATATGATFLRRDIRIEPCDHDEDHGRDDHDQDRASARG